MPVSAKNLIVTTAHVIIHSQAHKRQLAGQIVTHENIICVEAIHGRAATTAFSLDLAQ